MYVCGFTSLILLLNQDIDSLKTGISLLQKCSQCLEMCQAQNVCFIHIDECKNDWFLSVCLWHKFLLRIEPWSSSFLVMRKGHSFLLEEYLNLQYVKSDLVHFIIPIFCLSNWGDLCEKPFLIRSLTLIWYLSF